MNGGEREAILQTPNISNQPHTITKHLKIIECKDRQKNYKLDYRNFLLEMNFITDSYKDFNYMKIFKEKYGYIDSSFKKKYF